MAAHGHLPAVPGVAPRRWRARTPRAGAPAQPAGSVISAGALLLAAAKTARAFQARFGRKIHNFYGSSETGGIAYDRTGAATPATAAASA